MKWVILVLCLAPTLYESWSDKSGESKEDKIWDTVLLVVFSVSLAFGAWWLGYRPLPVIGLILGFRVLIFDYLVQHLLIKNKVIVGHWFTYNGKTSWFDRNVSGINPCIRFAARLIVFALAVWWYYTKL